MLISCLLAVVAAPCARAQSASPGGKVLLVRGMLTVFSLGLDDLARELTSEGLDVQVVAASMSRVAVDEIAQQYARGKLHGPLVLIGHSLGGDLLPGLARRLAGYDQPVDLMVMIDATNPSPPPENVRRCVNLYQSNSSPEWFRVFRGTPVRPANSSTQMVNIDIRRLPEHDEAARLNHFNMEASKWIHRMVEREVLQIAQAQTAEPARGATASISDGHSPERSERESQVASRTSPRQPLVHSTSPQ